MQKLTKIKILVVDHCALVGSGIVTILERNPEFQVIGLAKSEKEALRLIARYLPEVISIDVCLPNPSRGLHAIRVLRSRYPQMRVVVLTSVLDKTIIREALQQGVIGYLLKNSSAAKLVQAIRCAHLGKPTLSPTVIQLLIEGLTVHTDYRLTPREQQVLDLIAQGWNNQKIGEELCISLSTVQFHVGNILGKLPVHNRIEAAMFAMQHHLAKPPDASNDMMY